MDILLSVLLPPELDAYLRQLAKETERSRGGVVRFLIREYALTHTYPDLFPGERSGTAAGRKDKLPKTGPMGQKDAN